MVGAVGQVHLMLLVAGFYYRAVHCYYWDAYDDQNNVDYRKLFEDYDSPFNNLYSLEEHGDEDSAEAEDEYEDNSWNYNKIVPFGDFDDVFEVLEDLGDYGGHDVYDTGLYYAGDNLPKIDFSNEIIIDALEELLNDDHGIHFYLNDIDNHSGNQDNVNLLPVLHRRKRAVLRRRSSSSRKPSSRQSSSRGSSSSSSSRSDYGSRSTSSMDSSKSTIYKKPTSGSGTNDNDEKNKKNSKSESSKETSNKNSGISSEPKTGSKPSAPPLETSHSYPSSSASNVPHSGYPTAGSYPSGAKPNYPSAGYPHPTGTGVPSPGYPSTGPYPSGTKLNPPSAGYPHPTGQGVPNANYPTGSYPIGSNPNYPSAGHPHSPGQGPPNPSYPIGSYPSGTKPIYPSAGYPLPPGQGAPNQGYTTGQGVPNANYPTGSYPIGSNPNYPSPGHPHSPGQGPSNPSYPIGSYPSGNKPIYPSAGYPLPPGQGAPNQGYTTGLHPSGTKPNFPTAGYPHPPGPGLPNPGYPNYGGIKHNYPSPGYPYPYGGHPGSFPQSKYPSYPTSNFAGGVKPKISKANKAKQLLEKAIIGYSIHKAKKKSKFISPSSFPGLHNHGSFHGTGSIHGTGSMGSSNVQLGKKIIGTAIKLQIAKYAMKFGAKAAKAYFEHKLGRSLEERVINKFVSRYHRQRMRHYHKESRRYQTKSNKESFYRPENITLGEDCNRECNGTSLNCLFSFHVHLYQTMSRACYNCFNTTADCDKPECVVGSGRRKLVTVVNKQLPGPAIQVCHGDKVLVEVHNELPSSGVTLHFRGQSYFRTPFMEGTPGITQCGISPGNIFLYSFLADFSGTHFWHAQTGVLRSDGVFGPLIVKENINNETKLNYDVDDTHQLIVIHEELEKTGEEQLLDFYHKDGKIRPHSLLINGRGPRLFHDADYNNPKIPYSRVQIEQGKRNRLRMINAASSDCTISLRIVGHPVSVIYMDGFLVIPKVANTILISPGERFDVVVEPLPNGLYWIEAKGHFDCQNLTQYAVLESNPPTNESLSAYSFNPNTDETNRHKLPSESPKLTERVQNQELLNCNNAEVICSQNLATNLPFPSYANFSTPNLTVYLSLTKRKIHNENHYSLLYYDIASVPDEEQIPTYQINNLTLKLPPFPLLQDASPLKSASCSAAGVLRQHCVETFCECLHAQDVPLGLPVDIVLINEESAHPQTIYFHAHSFWVLSQENNFNESSDNISLNQQTSINTMTVMEKDTAGLLKRNIQTPPLRNGVTVPSGGYAIIRFMATNPGFWLLESSSVFKSAGGMGVIIRIGSLLDIPNAPKGIQKC